MAYADARQEPERSGEQVTRLEARTEVEGRTVDELAEEAVCRLLLRKGSAPPQGRLQSWTS
jgi:hypothetical protein